MKRFFVDLLLCAGLFFSLFTITSYAQDEKQWNCPECGAVNSGKFCTNCGHPQPERNPNWICPDCGASNKSSFCTRCGTEKPKDQKETVNVLAGTWTEGMLKIGASVNRVYALELPLSDCQALTVEIKLNDVNADPFGEWRLYGQNEAGTWSSVGSFELTDASSEKWAEYTLPVSIYSDIYALAIVPRYASSVSGSFNMGVRFIDTDRTGNFTPSAA